MLLITKVWCLMMLGKRGSFFPILVMLPNSARKLKPCSVMVPSEQVILTDPTPIMLTLPNNWHDSFTAPSLSTGHFFQILIILAMYTGHLLPFFKIIMTSKARSLYDAVFTKVKSLILATVQPTMIMTDYEPALMGGLSAIPVITRHNLHQANWHLLKCLKPLDVTERLSRLW